MEDRAGRARKGHEGLARQVAQGHPAGPRKAVVARHGQHDLVLRDGQGPGRRIVTRPIVEKADVQPAALDRRQLLAGAQGEQTQQDAGPSAPQRPQRLRHHAGPGDRVHRADIELADLARPDPPRRGGSPLDLGEDPPRALQELPAGRVQADAPAGAREEPDPEFLLQVGDRPGQRGLRHVEPPGRKADMLLLGRGEEIAEMPELHDRYA